MTTMTDHEMWDELYFHEREREWARLDARICATFRDMRQPWQHNAKGISAWTQLFVDVDTACAHARLQILGVGTLKPDELTTLVPDYVYCHGCTQRERRDMFHVAPSSCSGILET